MRRTRWPIACLLAALLATAVVAAQRPGGAPALPPSVRVVRSLSYSDSFLARRQRLDLYLPAEPKGDAPLPVVVNIHGGGFLGGDRTMGVGQLLPLVADGEYAVASIDYRLSGDAIWPAQIHDCKAAIRWVRAHAEEYHLDPDRIGVIGASAGGHLAAMIGLAGEADELEGEVGPHDGVSSEVRCVVDEFGPTDFLTMGGMHDRPGSPESRLIGATVPDAPEKARAASPVTYVSEGDPPFLILHGTEDPTVPFGQSERLAEALKAAGVECHFIPIRGAGHGGFRNPKVPARIRQFLDQHLRDRPAGPISEEPIDNMPPDGPR